MLYVVDEFAALGLLIERLAAQIRPRAAGDVITCDSAEPRSIAGLARLRPARHRRPQRPRQRRSRPQVAPDPLRHRHRPRPLPLAAGEFSRYEYDRDRNGRVLPRYPDHDNHIIDAVRYAMESVSGLKRAVVPR